MSGKETISKTLKFIIKTDKRIEDILNKLTARRTFTIKKYLELIEGENGIHNDRYTAERKLDQYTIITKNRHEVPYDFKELTGLSTVDLQSCGRTALALYRSYQAYHRRWQQYSTNKIKRKILPELYSIEIDSKENLIEKTTGLEKVIANFSETKVCKRLMKSEPSPPLQSNRYKPRKLPAILMFKNNLLQYERKGIRNPYKFTDGKLFIKLSTLRKRESIELELIHSEYHIRELTKGKVTGGRLFKNNRKKRWEFIAFIKIAKKTNQKQKKAIIGIDLGRVIDATMVVLIEYEKLKQERIVFLKETDLRKRLFNINQRIKTLQSITDTVTKSKRKKALSELNFLSGKRRTIINESCHRISKKIADIAQIYIDKGFEVHVAIGKLKGLQLMARKGNNRGKKNRGIINSFPYAKLTDFISYKCEEVGVRKIRKIKENWTSRTCHKCQSRNTTRPTQAQFICNDCGLHYHADVNGAINIACRYWKTYACNNCHELELKIEQIKEKKKTICKNCGKTTQWNEHTKRNSEQVTMIFLPNGKSEGRSKSLDHCSLPQGISDLPSYNESTGTTVHLKVEEVRKNKRLLSY